MGLLYLTFTLFLHLLLCVVHSSDLHYLASMFHEINAYSTLIQSQKYYFTYCLSNYVTTATYHVLTINQLRPSNEKFKIIPVLQRSISYSTRNNWSTKSSIHSLERKNRIPQDIGPVCTPRIWGCKVRERGENAG
jgi:hypothetical protein